MPRRASRSESRSWCVTPKGAGGAEAEVGWGGQGDGWDEVEEREASAESIEALVTMVPPLVEWAKQTFHATVAKRSS